MKKIIKIALLMSLINVLCTNQLPLRADIKISSEIIKTSSLSEKERFQFAIHDATEAHPEEINNKLLSIAPWNNHIIWDENKEKILVVSLMPLWPLAYYINEDVLNKILDKKDNIKNVSVSLNATDIDSLKTMKEDMIEDKWTLMNVDFPNHQHGLRGNDMSWVTVAPELQNFAYSNKKGLDVTELRKRLNQRLGLTPLHEKEKILIEQWISPKDLFRPAPDPEVIDSDALPDTITTTTTFFKDISPHSQTNILDDERLNETQQSKYGTESSKIDWIKSNTKTRYEYWFDITKGKQYTGHWAMPWTRLGYTYDYSPEAFKSNNPDAHFGFSEFCIKPASKVTIKGIYSLDKYATEKVYDEYQSQIKNNIEKSLDEQVSIIQDTQLPSQNDAEKNIKEAKSLLSTLKGKDLSLTIIEKNLQEIKQILPELQDNFKDISKSLATIFNAYQRIRHIIKAEENNEVFSPKLSLNDYTTQIKDKVNNALKYLILTYSMRLLLADIEEKIVKHDKK